MVRSDRSESFQRQSRAALKILFKEGLKNETLTVNSEKVAESVDLKKNPHNYWEPEEIHSMLRVRKQNSQI